MTAAANNVSRMTGTQKAAALIAILGEEVATEIVRTIPEKDAELLSMELAALGSLNAATATELLQECCDLLSQPKQMARGGPDIAKRVLVGAYGQDAANRLLGSVNSSMEGSSNRLDSLRRADPQQLARFLLTEHPQTIALILSHMDAKQSSTLLMKLPEELRSDVVKRLAQLRQFSPEMAEKVSNVLNRKLRSLGEQSRQNNAGFKTVAELLNRVDAATAKTILQAIEEEEPKLALEIRNQMFTFEDLLGVTEVAIRDIVGNVEKKTLALALKSASEDLKSHIFRTMSSRAVDMLKEDMDVLGPVRGRDVVKAQLEIVEIARNLEAEGKIVLKSEGEDEYIL